MKAYFGIIHNFCFSLPVNYFKVIMTLQSTREKQNKPISQKE